MNTVSLHQVVVERHAFQEEIDVLHLVLFRELPIKRMKSIRVSRAIVRRYTHADEHDLCPGGLRAFDELGQVAFDLLKGEAAQGIVSAELHDDDLRSMYLKRSRQACLRAARRFAARAGIR